MSSPLSARTADGRARDSVGYQLFVLAVSLVALLILGIETAVPVSPPTRSILQYADTAICALFFGDFVVQLVRARDRKRYFLTWGWLDLLSSIPMVDALRVGRAARVLRILRVLRVAKSTKLVADFVLRRRAEGAFLAAMLVTLLLVVFGSIAILQFEATRGGNITSAGDAIWWSVVTLTTVGYGDRYPVTPEGRFLAMLLMTAGIGLFGAFSGFVASWFLRPNEEEQEDDLEAIRTELVVIRAMLEEERALRRASAPEG